MKRIYKGDDDSDLAIYRENNPFETWENFKKNEAETAAKLKERIFQDQNDICGYCETNLEIDDSTIYEHHRGIEHFKTKSGCNRELDNWHLEWVNLFGVCAGGSRVSSDEKEKFSNDKEAYLSCDKFKARYEKSNSISGLNMDWNGKIFNPITMKERKIFFNFDKRTGEFLVNLEVCEEFSNENENENYNDIANLTLEVLNLNCRRLCEARLMIFIEHERIISNIVKAKPNDKERALQKVNFIFKRWLEKVNFFQTTREILLKERKF